MSTVAEKFAAFGWNIASVEDACDELERLSSMARAEAFRRVSVEQAVRQLRDAFHDRDVSQAAFAAMLDEAVAGPGYELPADGAK